MPCRGGWIFRIAAGNRGRKAAAWMRRLRATGTGQMADEKDETGGTWTTEAFLARCHADIRTIYAYWNGKRRGRPMPARRDLDPRLEIGRASCGERVCESG